MGVERRKRLRGYMVCDGGGGEPSAVKFGKGRPQARRPNVKTKLQKSSINFPDL